MTVARMCRTLSKEIKMAKDKSPKTPAPEKQADGNQGTRSGRPNPQAQPEHPREHESGYGGAGGEPRTGSK